MFEEFVVTGFIITRRAVGLLLACRTLALTFVGQYSFNLAASILKQCQYCTLLHAIWGLNKSKRSCGMERKARPIGPGAGRVDFKFPNWPEDDKYLIFQITRPIRCVGDF